MIFRLSLTNFDKRKWNGVEVIMHDKQRKMELYYVKYDNHGNPIRFGEKEYIYFKELRRLSVLL